MADQLTPNPPFLQLIESIPAGSPIEWIDVGNGAVVASITGNVGGGVSSLLLAGKAESAVTNSQSSIAAVDDQGAIRAIVTALQGDRGADAELNLSAGAIAAKLLDGVGRSSFLQAGRSNSGDNGPFCSASGHTTLTWGGSSFVSSTVILGVPGATGACYGVASPYGAPAGSAGCFAQVAPGPPGEVELSAVALSTEPNAGATVIFNFILWGT